MEPLEYLINKESEYTGSNQEWTEYRKHFQNEVYIGLGIGAAAAVFGSGILTFGALFTLGDVIVRQTKNGYDGKPGAGVIGKLREWYDYKK